MSLVSPQIKKQRGAALILALLIVSIVVILAATISSDFLVALRRVENQVHSQQAYAYLRGAEVMARQALMRDSQESGEIDHISEGWLDQDQEIIIQQGLMKGRLTDLQGRFNINNLATPANRGGTPLSENQKRFSRLLQVLPLEEQLDDFQAQAITRAVIDWIDADDRGEFESDYYSGAEVPKKTGNQALHSVSELLWIEGITPEIYNALKFFVTALPEDNIKINVNTASAEVLQALFDVRGSRSEGLQLVSERDEGTPPVPFDEVGIFLDKFGRILGRGNQQIVSANDIEVRSNYFLLSARALFLDREFQLQSVLFREGENDNVTVRVIARSYTDI